MDPTSDTMDRKQEPAEKELREVPAQAVAVDAAVVEFPDAPSSKSSFLHGTPLALMTLALLAAIFMVALDNAIISTAIPKITNQFNSLSDVGWYGSAYLLTQASTQPTFGKLYTLFNTKHVFTSSLLIFEVGSIVCAAANSSNAFIVGRAVAGLGAAGIVVGSLTIFAHIVEEGRRAVFFSLIGGVYGASAVIGPTLGGVFTDTPRLTWRFCFWINLPFGAIATAIVIFFYRPTQADTAAASGLTIREKLLKLDIGTAIILVGAVTSLLLGISWGGTKYHWEDSRVWGTLLGSGLLIIVFKLIQTRKKDEALIPTRIIYNRSIALSCIFTFLYQLSISAQGYYLPFFFQAVQGVEAKASGVQILPSGITIAVATFVSGALITVLGYYVPFMWTGSAMLTAGSYLLHTMTRESPVREWFGYQVLLGVGFGVAVQIPYLAVQVVTPIVDIPIANALISLFTALGGAIGVSIAQNVFQATLLRRLERIEGISVLDVVTSGGVGLDRIVGGSLLDLVRDAFNGAIADAFLVAVGAAGAAFLASLGMEWKRIRTRMDTSGPV